MKLALFLPLPFLIPIIGAICSRWPGRRTLLAIGFANLMTLFAFGSFCATRYEYEMGFGIWYLALPVFALIGLAFCTCRDAMLPALATDAQMPLTRIVALVEGFGFAGLLMGCLLPYWSDYLPYFFPRGWIRDGLRRTKFSLLDHGIDQLVLLLGTLYCICVAAVDRLHCPSPPSNSRSALHAFGDFFRDGWVILRQRDLRTPLFSQACAFGFIAIAGGILIGRLPWFFNRFESVDRAALWTSLGVGGGCCVALLQVHPRRLLAFVPVAATGIVIMYVVAPDWLVAGVPPTAFFGVPSVVAPSVAAVPSVALGAFSALLVIALWSTYLAILPASMRMNGIAFAYGIAYLVSTLIVLAFLPIAGIWVARTGTWLAWPDVKLWWLWFGLLFCGVALAWKCYFREALEWLIEIIIWPIYRIRSHGPGTHCVPLAGPLLIIANHSSWFDPIWLAKVIPRRVRPMMTSRFYDLPVLRWLMTHVVQAIRVQIAGFRREAPELGEAITLLDQGQCVLMFPEGRMRRNENPPLRNFGQGVWHILSKRPATPVVVCWVEGGWGSYFSYSGGLPTKNKRFDFWRHIDIAIEPPAALNSQLLKDQRATRRYLMQVCLDARRHLGLEPLAGVATLAEDEEEKEDG